MYYSIIPLLQYQDLLQILVDAKADSDDETAEEIVKDPYRNRLTNTEVVKTSLEFIIAGKVIKQFNYS